jgi:predicted phage replisome organizer
MSEVKWIKLSVDIFDDEKIEAIGTLPDGNIIQLAWMKLLCLAGKCNEGGLLMVTRELPYTDEMLAKRFDMEIGQVQRALDIFQRAGMVDVVENIYMVSNWSKYQNTQSLEEYKKKNRERQQKFREKKKQELLEDSNVTVTLQSNVKITDSDSISISNNLYSFSNNNNLDNYKYLIDNNVYKDSKYIRDTPGLDDVISDWMTYKDSSKPKSKNKYATEMSMSKVLTMIVNHDREYGTDAVREAVDMSIANQWIGIYWDKIEKRSNTPRKNPTPSYEMPTGLEKPQTVRQG